MNIEGLAAQGPGPKQEPIVKGKRAARAAVLPAHHQSQVKCKGLVRAVVHLSHRQKRRLEVDATVAQPKRTSAKAKMTPIPKTEPKGKNAPAPKAEAKETKQAEPKVEVKKEKVGGDGAPGGSRGSAEGQKRERKSRSDPDETVKESTKREALTRPDDVDSRPGAAAREASGDDLHSALGKGRVAPLPASKAMANRWWALSCRFPPIEC